MKNRIVKFSGGKSSFAVAAWVKENYPNDNIVLYFNDTLWEDEDLYRFNKEVSDKLKLPLLVQSRGITPPQLMVQQRYLANNRAGICSTELKIKVAMRFLKKGIIPEVEYWYNKDFLKQSIHGIRDEEFFENTTLYFGIGWEEMHRPKKIAVNWKPFKVQFPLIKKINDRNIYLEKYSIEEPRLYKMNFAHNNCKGRCVKAGKGHFQNLLMQDGKTFFELLEQELVLSEYARYVRQPAIKKGISKDYLRDDVMEFVTNGKKSDKIQNIIDGHKYLKNANFGVNSKGENINKPFSFMKDMTLEEFEQTAMQLSMWDVMDVGGCGCSVDYGLCSIDS
ncbi:hypothetical protein ACOMCU_01310 [Lysinibacillus sp. UGB7]|uniref:hypothetical protein n=1 Tax=Lysinibacillus sp. UGB7 TaxID=3411039 RepID=UPI003B7E0090